MKKIITILSIICFLTLFSCTDAKRAEYTRYGKSANIDVYSFGQKIYSGKSSGKLLKKEGGYLFVEESSGQTIQTLGQNTTYIIRYE